MQKKTKTLSLKQALNHCVFSMGLFQPSKYVPVPDRFYVILLHDSLEGNKLLGREDYNFH